MTSTRRHVHSPRVRRLARDHGVALDGLVGTGPRGRVTPSDVLHVEAVTALDRNEQVVAQPSRSTRAAGPSQATAVIEVDVTRVAKGTHVLLAAVIEAAVPALRQALPDRGPVGGVRVVAHEGGLARTIRHADRLSMAGLLHALETAPDDPGEGIDVRPSHGVAPEERTLAVHDAGGDGFLFEQLPVAVGDLAALSLGSPVERAAVIVQPDGERGIGVRTFVHLALTYDDQLSRARATRLLAAVRARLEGLGQNVGGGST